MTIWWVDRSARERWLIGVMLTLVAALLGWLLIVRPLSDALDAAKARHANAALLLAEARARAHPPGGGGPAVAGPVDAIVQRTAADAGFAAARVAARGPGRAGVALDAARPQALFGWVVQMESRGLVVERLRAQANADHSVAAEMTLRGRR